MKRMSARHYTLVIIVLLLALPACGSSHVSVAQHSGQAAPSTKVHATATPLSAPIGLSLQGTSLYSEGHPVTLLGFDRPSLEYSCTGDGHFTLADFQAMRKWGANVVRITTSSEFWANAGASCPNYRNTVRAAVANARTAHLFVILDLQWSAPFDSPADRKSGGVQCPMPDTGKDVAMWQDLAQIYRSDPGVLFDLYGEPYGVSWSTWLNGGTVTAGCYVVGGPTLQLESGTYQAIGMHDLADKIRAIAPHNIIVVPGLNWGYDLSEILNGYALTEQNVVYDTHPFDYSDKQPSDWDQAFGDTAQAYPVIADEFGSYDCATQYDDQAISYFSAHHMSWLAWAWEPGSCSGPSLITDWSGTPTIPYGSYIQQQMLAVSETQA